ncbi:unnamed protein product [Nesidiocoris tenuis]|uniref:Uncharacterized protein n=1 Tax=Nesidiocoris tenuis TaxID=355587 RepID=A0A6H5HGW7_9HEMI|nr:unnamed protein product [Nesidiocoris tenuis]
MSFDAIRALTLPNTDDEQYAGDEGFRQREREIQSPRRLPLHRPSQQRTRAMPLLIRFRNVPMLRQSEGYLTLGYLTYTIPRYIRKTGFLCGQVSTFVRRIASRFSYIENHQPTTSKPAVSVTFHELMDVTVHHNGSVVPVCQDSRPGQQSCLHVYRHQKRDARPGARCDQQRIFLRQSKMGDHFLADRQSSWRLFGLEINVGPDAGLRRLLVHHPQSGTFFSERRILWKAGEDY